MSIDMEKHSGFLHHLNRQYKNGGISLLSVVDPLEIDYPEYLKKAQNTMSYIFPSKTDGLFPHCLDVFPYGADV